VEEFPSNSEKSRGRPDRQEPKKVESVVQGKVERRKKPLGRRFLEYFGGSDRRSIGEYITESILVPAIKDTLADAVQQGLEFMLFGEARSTSRRTGRRPGEFGTVAYHRMSSRVGRDDPRDRDRREISRRGRANFDFDEIILSTRVEAEEVIDRMFDLINQYQVATVSDLYDLCNIQSSYTDQKWGWEDFRGAGIQRVTNGYLLDLPRPEPIR